MRRLYRLVLAVLAFTSLYVLSIYCGCSGTSHKGFAIYLTAADVPPDQILPLASIELAAEPIIAASNIVSYNSTTHEITLTPDVFARIISLEVSVRGKSFIVCVDNKPIYRGAFWTPISSISYDGVTIWQPLGSQGTKTIKLDLGYPLASFYTGEDPRNNAEVIQSLEEAGKLVTSPEILPRSMKGYELYSWQENGQWHFTLITGTNRNKTPDEITAESNAVSTDEWVQIHVIGVTAIKQVIARIPHGEWVTWLGDMAVPAKAIGIAFMFPGASTVDSIAESAKKHGLNFHTVKVP
jgi:hypothetical protein